MMLGPRWSEAELENFYQSYRNNGKEWQKVAASVPSRTEEMVEGLYSKFPAYLSLPEGIASSTGLIALMKDFYATQVSQAEKLSEDEVEQEVTIKNGEEDFSEVAGASQKVGRMQSREVGRSGAGTTVGNATLRSDHMSPGVDGPPTAKRPRSSTGVRTWTGGKRTLRSNGVAVSTTISGEKVERFGDSDWDEHVAGQRSPVSREVGTTLGEPAKCAEPLKSKEPILKTYGAHSSQSPRKKTPARGKQICESHLSSPGRQARSGAERKRVSTRPQFGAVRIPSDSKRMRGERTRTLFGPTSPGSVVKGRRTEAEIVGEQGDDGDDLDAQTSDHRFKIVGGGDMPSRSRGHTGRGRSGGRNSRGRGRGRGVSPNLNSPVRSAARSKTETTDLASRQLMDKKGTRRDHDEIYQREDNGGLDALATLADMSLNGLLAATPKGGSPATAKNSPVDARDADQAERSSRKRGHQKVEALSTSLVAVEKPPLSGSEVAGEACYADIEGQQESTGERKGDGDSPNGKTGGTGDMIVDNIPQPNGTSSIENGRERTTKVETVTRIGRRPRSKGEGTARQRCPVSQKSQTANHGESRDDDEERTVDEPPMDGEVRDSKEEEEEESKASVTPPEGRKRKRKPANTKVEVTTGADAPGSCEPVLAKSKLARTRRPQVTSTKETPMKASKRPSTMKAEDDILAMSSPMQLSGADFSLPAKLRNKKAIAGRDSKKDTKRHIFQEAPNCRHASSNATAITSVKARLIHCLTMSVSRPDKVQRWCRNEWFYSSIDLPWFARNEFEEYLEHAGLSQVAKLTRTEWGVIRSSLGKPRRLSIHFLKEEREKLSKYRDAARERYQELRAGHLAYLPDDLALPLTVGQRVIAKHPRTRQISDGSILTVDRGKCRVQFDQPELGVEHVLDIDIMPMNPVENLPEVMRGHSTSFDLHMVEGSHGELKLRTVVTPGGIVRATLSDRLEKAATPLKHAHQAHSPPSASCASMLSIRAQALAAAPDTLEGTVLAKAAVQDAYAAQQALLSSRSKAMTTPGQAHAREQDARALLDLTRCLDKKEALLVELRKMDDEVDIDPPLRVMDIFQRQYATILVQLKEVNKQVEGALVRLRQRNRYQDPNVTPWQRSLAATQALATGTPQSQSQCQGREPSAPIGELAAEARRQARTMVAAVFKALGSVHKEEDQLDKLGQALNALAVPPITTPAPPFSPGRSGGSFPAPLPVPPSRVGGSSPLLGPSNSLSAAVPDKLQLPACPVPGAGELALPDEETVGKDAGPDQGDASSPARRGLAGDANSSRGPGRPPAVPADPLVALGELGCSLLGGAVPGKSGYQKEAAMLTELMASCVATLLMIQTCTERKLPHADVVLLLDSALASLRPHASRNQRLHRDIEHAVAMIKSQIVTQLPASLSF